MFPLFPILLNYCATLVLLDFQFNYFFRPDILHVDAAPEVVEKPGDNSLSRLKSLYIQAKELSENEVR